LPADLDRLGLSGFAQTATLFSDATCWGTLVEHVANVEVFAD
jgi:hypothetical protein